MSFSFPFWSGDFHQEKVWIFLKKNFFQMVGLNKIPDQKPVLKMLVPLFPDERLVKESYFELDKILFLVFPQRRMSDFRVFNIFHNNEFLLGGKMPGGGQKYVRNEMTLALTSIRRTLVFVENSLSAL